ncbi:MAG TPA: MFS transporter [Candidatus Paceibacterota bacterium]|nr:MFS transporter [Candidatus Paceibacterota bacterium]
MQKKVLPILFLTLLLDMIGTGMVFPIIPIIFTDATSPHFLLQGYSTGMQFFIAGLITALFGLMQFIAAPILGELSDVYGRKKLLTLGVGVLAVSQLLFGFGIAAKLVWLLLIARAIAGLAAANFSIAQATIADISSPEDRAKNFGLIGAAFGIGFILGPLLSGWIAGVTGDAAAPFWFAGALGIVNLIFISLFLPETNHNRKAEHNFHIFKGIQNIKAAFDDKDARPVYLSSFLYLSGFSFFTSFVGILLVSNFGQDEAGVGTYFGIVGACIVVTQLFILRFLTKHYKERQILRYTMLAAAFILFLHPFAPNALWLFALIPFFAVPQALTMANMTALVSKSVSPQKQGAALGINSSLIALAQGVVPLIAGGGAGIIGVHAPFVAAALFMIGAWWILFGPGHR